MRNKSYLKITCSFFAITAASLTPAASQSANGWTGGSSYYYSCSDGAGGTTTCAAPGDNAWENGANWQNGMPNLAQDVNIGLSTYQSGTSGRPIQHDTVVIGSGTNAQAGQINIGFSGGRSDSGTFGSGSLTNNGNLTVLNGVLVGATGSGTFFNNGNVDVNNGSIVVSNGSYTNNGDIDIASGNLIIGRDGVSTFDNNVGSTLDIGENLIVGEQQNGRLTSYTDITVGGDTVLGQQANATGVVYLDGADLSTSGNLTVGENGSGFLLVDDESTVDTGGSVVIGQSASSRENVVAVAGSMQTEGSLTVGQYGSGIVFVAGGGVVDTEGRVTLGAGENGEGFVYNTGLMNNHDGLIVGSDGLGGMLVDGPNAVTNTAGNVSIGDDESGEGIVIVREGTMNNGGRLDVGYEGEGYLSVEDGGNLNNSIGVMGRQNDARGFGIVKGTGSLWDNRTSLTIAQDEGSEAVLTINDGGTVRIADGEGTLLIAADAGSRGVLNIGALSPTGEDYGIDGRVSDLLDGADNDPTPLGAGTLDAAYVQFGEGEGTVNFSHTGTELDDYRFKAGFVGEGTVNHYQGFTVLDGDSSGFTGAIHVEGGTLVANNVLAGDVDVASGAVLRIGDQNGTTGDVVNDIANEGLVEFNRSNLYGFDSVITGTGSIAQIGSGTTVLTTANTYTGGTTITDGTLQLGDGGTSGSIGSTSGVAIGDSGTLAFNRSDNVLWDRDLSGSGTIAQIGTGITRLTEDNSAFVGTARVDVGTLSVNGILGGTVAVNDGGTLEGLGTVGTTAVHEGGTIAPGNGGIGTLTVDGDFSQEAGSFYQAGVLSTGESDLLHVNGLATISDDAVLNVKKLDSGRYELEHRYTVLTADGGLTGDYDLTGDTFVSTFYRVEDAYDDNNAFLDVAQHRLFQEAGSTRNQLATATAAQELKAERDVNGTPTNELFRAIAYLPTDADAQHAFDQVSGEIYASAKVGMIEDSRFVRDATGDRLRGAFGVHGSHEKVVTYEKGADGAPAPREVDADKAEGIALWTHGFGSWATGDGDGNAGDYDRSIGGVFFGADAPVFDSFRLGVVGGYSHSTFSVDSRSSSQSSDNYNVGVYGGGQWNNLGLRMGADYTWHDVSTSRSPTFLGFSDALSSDYKAGTAQVFGDIGYKIDFASVSFEPFAGVAYVNLRTEDFNEHGGAAALRGSGDNTDATFTTLGLRAASNLMLGGLDVTANGMVGWRHTIDEVTPTSTHAFTGSNSFTVAGVPLAQDMAVIEAGLTAAINESLSVGASYSGEFGNGVQDHGLRGNVNWKF